MKFRNFQLLIADSVPTVGVLQNLCNIGLSVVKDYGSDWYEVQKEVLEDRFLWMYCEYDNATIYNENVLNGENDAKEQNPRSRSQVELRKQLFVCYDITTRLLYMSNIEKRGFVKHYISHTLQKDASMKNIYTSLDEFQDAVTTIKGLKFVQQRNFMNLVPESIFQQQANLYGLDCPEKITMQVDYGGTPVAQVKGTLQNFKQWRDAGQFESIILIGLDDAQVEQSFDFSSMIQAIELSVAKDGNGRYDPAVVKRDFLNRIR